MAAASAVVIAFNVDLTIRANVAMSAAFHLGFTQVPEAWFKIGFAYRDGKWAAINEGATTFGDPVMDSDAIFQGQVRASAGPEVMAKLMLYDTFGPALGFGLKAGVDLDAKMEADGLMARVKIYLSGSVLVQVSLKIPVINVDVADLTILEGDIFRWNLVDWNYDYYDLLSVPRPDPDPDPDPEAIDALEFAEAIEVTELLAAGDEEWYEDRGPIAAKWVDGPAHRGEGVTDSTTLKIDFPAMTSASCVSIAALAGNAGEESVFAAEWGTAPPP